MLIEQMIRSLEETLAEERRASAPEASDMESIHRRLRAIRAEALALRPTAAGYRSIVTF